jgi:uncharacterized delta-60 repeat protein
MKTKARAGFSVLHSPLVILAASTVAFLTHPASAQVGQRGAGTACYAADPDARVYAVAVQADGKTLIGGDFKNVRGVPRNHIARLNVDGSLDTTFDPGAQSGTEDASVSSLAVQADGRILVGGYFTNLAGNARSNLGRLNANGSIDPSFNPGANGNVQCLALQTNGQILVGGLFTALAGQPRTNLARLNTNGTLDTSFSPAADGTVMSLAVQADQKILVGGTFNTLGGQARTNIGRLNSDGTLDNGFNPGATYGVYCLAVQADQKILAGGDFTTLGGYSRTNIGRLNTNGVLDTTFSPSALCPGPFGYNGDVSSLQVQADGNILVGGNFTVLGGQPRTNLGRLDPTGTVDTNFNPGAGGSSARVDCLALQTNRILVGGWFDKLGGQARNNLGRLMPDGGFDLSFNPPAIAGPIFPPPWGVGFAQVGTNMLIGRTAGVTWYFTNNAVPPGTIAYWGATNGGVRLSFDDALYEGQEILSYRPALSDLTHGQAVWAGQTRTPVTLQTVYTRFVLNVTNQATGAALPLFEAGSLRLPTCIGGVVLVTNSLVFKAVLRFQASYSVDESFTPALDFFDAIPKNPPETYRAYPSLGAGFYYLTNSLALNRIVRVLSTAHQVEAPYQNLPGLAYMLDRSTNLTDWRQVTGAVADVYGVVPFVDRAPPSGRAFYRVRCP